MKKTFLILIFICFFSCEAIFEEDLSNDVVTVLAPTESSEVNAGNIRFSWQSLEDATSYQIQIATPNFENASQILLDSIIETTSIIDSLRVGTYQWRLRAINTSYQTPYNTINFTVN